jgi:Maltose operon periplasmic protein precursor (MalM)
MIQVRFAIVAVLGTLALAGCASPPPPPIVTLDGRACPAVPDFSAVRPLQLDGENRITVEIDQHTPCWHPANGPSSVYLLFSLPDRPTPYLLTVTSRLKGQTIFAPRVLMLDGFGKVLREMPRTSFQYHSDSLYLGVRVYPGEKYAMVASDPQAVGKDVSQLRDGTQVYTATSGGVVFTVHTGFEAKQNLVFAVNGDVTVSIAPIPVVR